MTQEEKNLLLKDLCARLPYRTLISISSDGNKYRMEEIRNALIGIDTFKITIDGYDIEHIKPYLFPLSSITEEQKEDMIKSSCGIGSDKNVFDWFNKNHIDYRGLIPMGLAIDCTNLNIY